MKNKIDTSFFKELDKVILAFGINCLDCIAGILFDIGGTGGEMLEGFNNITAGKDCYPDGVPVMPDARCNE